MTKEKMTIHQALCELKILDKRINTLMLQFTPVAKKKTYEVVADGVNLEDWTERAKSSYQSIIDLITRRTAIKSAVVQSNATTKVTVMDKEYTVAEIIELLKYGTTFCNDFSSLLSKKYSYTMKEIQLANADIDKRADAHVVQLYGNGDKKNVADDSKKARDEYISAQTVMIVDPLDIVGRVTKMQEFSDKFRVEADSALSTSNAITTIEVEYETKKI